MGEYKKMAKSTFDFRSYFDGCAEKRESADDIFRTAILRTERTFRRCHADGLSDDGGIDYGFLADLLHGIRLADSMDAAYDTLFETETDLPVYAEAVLAVFSALDVRNKSELVSV